MSRRNVTVAEAAEHYGLSVKTVRRYIADGRIPAHRLGPKLVRLDLDEVDAVLTARTQTAETVPAVEASRDEIIRLVEAAPDLSDGQRDIIRAVLGGAPVAASNR
ncbi:helix-turn-helix transcriptional regulator [Rhodococcus zopfii]